MRVKIDERIKAFPFIGPPLSHTFMLLYTTQFMFSQARLIQLTTTVFCLTLPVQDDKRYKKSEVFHHQGDGQENSVRVAVMIDYDRDRMD